MKVVQTPVDRNSKLFSIMQESTDFTGFSYENEDLLDRAPEITGSATYDKGLDFDRKRSIDSNEDEKAYASQMDLEKKDSTLSMEFS